MSAGLVITYIAILGILYVLGKSCWKPLFLLFNFFFQGALGALGIYLFNLLAGYWRVEIPLNPFNSLFTGFLGLPGLLSLLIIRYWIKI
ncbi:MAG: pro-sigmaK processing inhibitor BofA family protein [Bacillota bacterium]